MTKTSDHLYVRFGIPESFGMMVAGWLLGTIVWSLIYWSSPLPAWTLPHFWLLFLIIAVVGTTLSSAIPQAKLTPEGIYALDTCCRLRHAKWTEVLHVREFSVLGLTWLWIYAKGLPYALWLPFFRSTRDESLAFLEQHVTRGPMSTLVRHHLARQSNPS